MVNKRKTIFLILILIISTTISYGYNKVEKIGIIDLTEVFDKFVEDKEIAKEFNEYKKSSTEKLDKMRKEINDLRNQLINLSNSLASMGTNTNYQLMMEYDSFLKEYNSKIDSYRNELKTVDDKLNYFRESLKQYVYKDILNYIRSYGDRNGFSIIFDTRGNLIYYSKGNDVTEDLNKWIKVQEDAKKKY